MAICQHFVFTKVLILSSPITIQSGHVVLNPSAKCPDYKSVNGVCNIIVDAVMQIHAT
jgi:hypothetical protein